MVVCGHYRKVAYGSGSFHQSLCERNSRRETDNNIEHIVMKNVSPISLGPFPDHFLRKIHLSALKR